MPSGFYRGRNTVSTDLLIHLVHLYSNRFDSHIRVYDKLTSQRV